MAYYYYNASGHRFEMPQQPLEPPDCWGNEHKKPEHEEYDRGEDEMNGKFNRNKTIADRGGAAP